MKIILDTNILFADPGLTGGLFRVLFDYANKTRSGFIMPRIVYEELLANRKRQLKDAKKKFETAKRSLQILLPETNLVEHQFSIENEVNAYAAMLKTRLNFTEQDIFEYPDSYLRDVIQRAIHKHPPCHNKEEVRDAVLWLSILDIAENLPDQSVIFISNNKSDFGAADDNLNPELAKECTARGIQLTYFTSLDSFAKEHAIHVEFVTECWIAENLPVETVLLAAKTLIENAAKSEIVWNLDFPSDASRTESTGHFQRSQYHDVKIESFFVNELDDNTHRIEAFYKGEVEVECEVYVYGSPPMPISGWTLNPQTQAMEMDIVLRPATESRIDHVYVHPELYIGVEIIVRDQVVEQWRLIDTW